MSRSIHISIEELVLHDFDHVDRRALHKALLTAITRVFTTDFPMSELKGASFKIVESGSFVGHAKSKPIEIAEGIATSIKTAVARNALSSKYIAHV